jgi:ribonuclease Z
MAVAMELVLLGTGSPLPSPDRCGNSQLVMAGDERVLVDLGWGAARRIFAAMIPLPSIDTVCFTHMHSDHITDVPDFLIMRWTGGARRPLTVYGPVGTKRMIDGFLAALQDDIKFRFAHHGEKLSQDGITVNVKEFPATPDPSFVAEIGGMTIEAFEVDHKPVEPAVGYRLQRAGRSLVLSGDTNVCPPLARAAKDADVFVCEAININLQNALRERLRAAGNEHGAAMLGDVPSYHITTQNVAETARDANVKHLVLSHLIPPIPNDGPIVDAFVAGMSDIFSGPITVGRDLQRISIEE